MAAKRYEDLRRRTFSPEQLERIEERVEQELLEINLRGLRELTGKTQEEIADLVKMSQGQVSVTERRGDHLVSTLRRYVEALGGELEVSANFGDKRYRLHGV
jgi:transcriptional regulator